MKKDDLKYARRRIKSLEQDLDRMRMDKNAEWQRANSYRTCLQEILMAIGEYGPSISVKWIGSKIGGMLK